MPRTLTSLESEGAARFSGIWWRPAEKREDNAHWTQDEESFEGQLSPSRFLLDARVATAPRRLARMLRPSLALFTMSPTGGLSGVSWGGLQRTAGISVQGYEYAQVYQEDRPDRVSAESHGLDAVKHLAWCREQASVGARPVALSVATSGVGPVTVSSWQRPVVAVSTREALARRQARAAVVLLRLGQGERVWPLWQHSTDPMVRSWLVHEVSPLGSDPLSLLARFEAEKNVSVRRVLLLAVGEFADGQVPAAVRTAWTERLLAAYRSEPDAGLRASGEWLLRRWGHGPALAKTDGELAREAGQRGAGADGRGWYVTTEGHTMVRFAGPVVFEMGSPSSEPDRTPPNEPLHRVRIGRSFALASKEVTVAQFERFKQATNSGHSYTKRYSPEQDGPMVGVMWYEAAQYCRWLSEQEGVPEAEMCYPSIPNIKEWMRLPKDYLSRRGYRLPTEAEWEYACRAGAATSRYYGSGEELLGRYAWYLGTSKDRAWPGGSRKPNDFGLFDMLGNATEWCGEPVFRYRLSSASKNAEDLESGLMLDERQGRALRGASFVSAPANVRSAIRNGNAPSDRVNTVGVRVARTYP